MSPALLNALIAVEQVREPCWRVRKYLGSMLTMEFGRCVTRIGRKGPYEVGSSYLGVRDCAWRFEAGGVTQDSDYADEETAPKLTGALMDSCLVGCSKSRSRLTLIFSNGAQLALDTTNRYGAEDDEVVAALQLGGGALLHVLPRGRIEFAPAELQAGDHVEVAA